MTFIIGIFFICSIQGLRAQIDRDKYKNNMQQMISGIKGLSVLEGTVEDLVITQDRETSVTGIKTGEHLVLYLALV